MRSPVLTLSLACLLLLSACSIGGSDDDDPTPTATPMTAATSASAGATETPRSTSTPAPTATATEPPASPTPTEPAATPTATSGASEATATTDDLDPELAAQIEEIKTDTVSIRGLELLEPVPIAVISRDQLRENLTEDLEEDYSQEEADQETREFWLLRLIDDPSLDLYAFELDLLSEQVLGYYNPKRDELFVVSDAEGISALAEFTLTHELVHAIQDLHYDIERVRFYDQGDEDRDRAAVSLIEGDAELAQISYAEQMSPERLLELLAEASTLSSKVIDSAPPYLRERLYFPYEAGIEFVQAAFEDGGYDAVNAIYADPPRSTEQIIHPEKYFEERDDPQSVEMPDLSGALGAGWAEVDDDSLGEFDLSVMLRENGATNPEAAAAGWDGARYSLYDRDGGAGALIAVQTVWDSPEDATEFRDALVSTLAGPLDGEIGDAGQGRFLGLREVNGAVWFITSVDRAAVEAALAAIGG
jgi:hypothetical protein